MPTRSANATWTGDIMKGTGRFDTEAGVGSSYAFSTRFGEERGSNPEELIAAAQAACFSMALSGNLARNGATPESVKTDARCTIDRAGDGFKITKMEMTVTAKASGIDDAKFQQVLQQTKDTCPVSMALRGNMDISVTGQLA